MLRSMKLTNIVSLYLKIYCYNFNWTSIFYHISALWILRDSLKKLHSPISLREHDHRYFDEDLRQLPNLLPLPLFVAIIRSLIPTIKKKRWSDSSCEQTNYWSSARNADKLVLVVVPSQYSKLQETTNYYSYCLFIVWMYVLECRSCFYINKHNTIQVSFFLLNYAREH